MVEFVDEKVCDYEADCKESPCFASDGITYPCTCGNAFSIVCETKWQSPKWEVPAIWSSVGVFLFGLLLGSITIILGKRKLEKQNKAKKAEAAKKKKAAAASATKGKNKTATKAKKGGTRAAKPASSSSIKSSKTTTDSSKTPLLQQKQEGESESSEQPLRDVASMEEGNGPANYSTFGDSSAPEQV